MEIKKLLIKKQEKQLIDGKERVIADQKTYYIKNIEADYHCQDGIIKKEDLKKTNKRVRSSLGKEFTIIKPNFIDSYKKIKRMPQIIPLKDISFMIAETGINHKSKVLDSGTGSGALSCFLANIAKEVISYEIRDDFIEVAKSNKKMLGLTNLKIKKQDIYQKITEKDFDLITLDVPEPWKAIKNIESALKIGGFLISYSPTLPQVMDFVESINENENFVFIKSVELTERQWEVDKRKVRPKSQPIGHSGFLTLVRRV